MTIGMQVHITVRVEDRGLENTLLREVRAMPNIKALPWAPEGTQGKKAPGPDIVIIGDAGEEGRALAEVASLRRDLPEAALFVVSDNKDPQHIVRMMKAGCSEYLLVPVEAAGLRKAVEEVRARLIESFKGSAAVYSFISCKGGLGATVLSVNTAAALALGGRNVALYDMAFQAGDSSVLLDVQPETTVMDVCKNFHRLDVSLLQGAMTRHSSGLHLLAAPLSPEDSEEVCLNHMVKILGLLDQLYSHVIIDCTSMFVNHHSIEAFSASDRVFIVTDLSLPAIRNAVRLSRLMAKLGIDEAKIEFVVNRFIKDSVMSIKDGEKNLGKEFFWLFPNHFDDIVSSINHGMPLVQAKPRSSFSRNVYEFVAKLHEPVRYNGYRGIKTAFGKSI